MKSSNGVFPDWSGVAIAVAGVKHFLSHVELGVVQRDKARVRSYIGVVLEVMSYALDDLGEDEAAAIVKKAASSLLMPM